MNKEKLQEMIRRGQDEFLRRTNNEMGEIARILISYLYKKNQEDYERLLQYFHRVKGTAGTLELTELSAVSADIEALLEEEKEEEAYTDTDQVLVNRTGEFIDLVEQRLGETASDESAETAENNFRGSLEHAGRVIVVDKDSEVLNEAEKVLRNQGYSVYVSDDIEEATDYIKDGEVDLALIDAGLAESTGFTGQSAEVPVILMTDSSDQLPEDELWSEFDGELEKPFKAEELMVRVNEAANLPESLSDGKEELTEAFTRKEFAEAFEIEKEKHLTSGSPFAVAFMDLDNFRAINDYLGTAFSDTILVKLVEAVKEQLNKESKIFRFSGDEFLVLFSGMTGEEALSKIESIRGHFNSRVFTEENKQLNIPVTFSSGIAEYSEGVKTKSKLLENADQALYRAKEKGKNQTVLEDKSAGRIYGNKILVVDDEILLANIIKTRLGYLGYEVDYVKDGQEALNKLRQNHYDLVLLDIMLPKVTGIEVLKTFKNGNFHSEPKIVMISGKQSESAVMESLRLGADDFFKKPLSLEVLEHKIKKILTS